MLCLLSVFFAYGALFSAELSFHDLKGQGISKATVGVPFGITCSVPEKIDTQSLVHITKTFKGISIKNHQARTMISMINGVATHTTAISFVVVADECGIASCGPLELSGTFGRISLPKRDIEIVLESPVNNQDPQARLALSQTTIFERQAVAFTLECIIPQHAEDITIKLPEKYQKQFIFDDKIQRHVINKQQVKTVWTGYFLPEKLGVQVIPALAITYRTVVSGFFFGFGSSKTETVYTNSLELTVQRLPADAQSVQAVGIFKSLEGQIDRKQGSEAFVYKLSLQADNTGDLLRAHRPELPEIDGIRIYPGKDTIMNNILTWEYIIQVTKAGKYILEGPLYNYFDVQQKCVKTLQPQSEVLQIDLPLQQKIHDSFVNFDEPTQQAIEHKDTYVGNAWYKPMLSMKILYGNIIFLIIVTLSILLYRWLCNYSLIQNFSTVVRGYYYLLLAYQAASKKNRIRVYQLMIDYIVIVLRLEQTPTKRELKQQLSLVAGESSSIITCLEAMEQLLYAPSKEISASELKKLIKKFFLLTAQLTRKQSKKLSVDRFALVVLMSFSLAGQSLPTVVEKIQSLRNIQTISMSHHYYAIEREIQALKKQEGLSGACSKTSVILRMIAHTMPPVIAQLFALLSMWTLFLGWLRNWQLKTKISLLCMLMLSFFSVYVYVYERGNQRAIVNSLNVDVYAGPGSAFEKIGSLVYLDEIFVKAHYDSWMKISHNGLYGWVPAEHLVLQESVV